MLQNWPVARDGFVLLPAVVWNMPKESSHVLRRATPQPR